MPFPQNTPNIDDLINLPAGEIAQLPVELLAAMQREIDAAAKQMAERINAAKRHATGKGNAPKEAMIAAARARGFSPADDNEADAIAILLWALETKGGLQ